MEGHRRFTAIGRQFGIGIVGLGEGKGGVRAMPDAEDGSKTIATLEAIRQSIREERPVRVKGL